MGAKRRRLEQAARTEGLRGHWRAAGILPGVNGLANALHYALAPEQGREGE